MIPQLVACSFERTPEGGTAVRTDAGLVPVTPSAARLLPLIDGRRDVTALRDALGDGARREEVFAALDELGDAGLLVTRVAPPGTPLRLSRRSLVKHLGAAAAAGIALPSIAQALAGRGLPTTRATPVGPAVPRPEFERPVRGIRETVGVGDAEQKEKSNAEAQAKLDAAGPAEQEEKKAAEQQRKVDVNAEQSAKKDAEQQEKVESSAEQADKKEAEQFEKAAAEEAEKEEGNEARPRQEALTKLRERRHAERDAKRQNMSERHAEQDRKRHDARDDRAREMDEKRTQRDARRSEYEAKQEAAQGLTGDARRDERASKNLERDRAREEEDAKRDQARDRRHEEARRKRDVAADAREKAAAERRRQEAAYKKERAEIRQK